ncbi:MAG: CapA family protein [Treponema sp.]|nr:CapA family protein [Treponema sp.]
MKRFLPRTLFFSLSFLLFFSCETVQHAQEEGRLPAEATIAELEDLSAQSQLEFVLASPYIEDPDSFEDGTPIATAGNPYPGADTLLISFAGDLMAHNELWKHTNDYDKMYDDVREMLTASDLSLANMETPVDAKKPFSTYPSFNVHPDYADAAVRAGFNLFSLSNNHTNDKGFEGIQETEAYFSALADRTNEGPRPVHYSGLKDGKDADFSYAYFEYKGWKILFLAVTEILNSGDSKDYINFIKQDTASRMKFTEYVGQLREDNPCDLFILSVHCGEPEYILTIAKEQLNFYHNLLEKGVDVVWANHPHVARDWEVVVDKERQLPAKMVFYSQGNTISGQRRSPSFDFPTLVREYTGDGYITQVRFLRDETGIRIVSVNPVLITTYITTERFFQIKKITDDFIAELKKNGRDKWAKYLESRRKLMKQIKGKLIWQ